MIKTFCDICHNEILKSENEYKLECLKLDRNKEQYDYAYKGENVCEKCIYDINNFIANHLRTHTIINKKEDTNEKSCTNCSYYSPIKICDVGHLCLDYSEWTPKLKKGR